MVIASGTAKARGCCLCIWIVIAFVFFNVGLIMILAGCTRLTGINRQYKKMECEVIDKQIRELPRTCVLGKCTSSHWDGSVEFNLEDSRKLWTTVITSYSKNEVYGYMDTHFNIGQNTTCYVDKNSRIIFQLHPTTALLVLSIIFLSVGTLIFLGIMYWNCKRKRHAYVNLDEENDIFL